MSCEFATGGLDGLEVVELLLEPFGVATCELLRPSCKGCGFA